MQTCRLSKRDTDTHYIQYVYTNSPVRLAQNDNLCPHPKHCAHSSGIECLAACRPSSQRGVERTLDADGVAELIENLSRNTRWASGCLLNLCKNDRM